MIQLILSSPVDSALLVIFSRLVLCELECLAIRYFSQAPLLVCMWRIVCIQQIHDYIPAPQAGMKISVLPLVFGIWSTFLSLPILSFFVPFSV